MPETEKGPYHLGLKRKGVVKWETFRSIAGAKRHLYELEHKRNKPFKNVVLMDNDGNHIALLYGHTEVVKTQVRADELNGDDATRDPLDPIYAAVLKNVADVAATQEFNRGAEARQDGIPSDIQNPQVHLQAALARAEGKLAAIRRILFEDTAAEAQAETLTPPDQDTKEYTAVLSDLEKDIVADPPASTAEELFEQARRADQAVVEAALGQRD